jgi:hypothetical protein
LDITTIITTIKIAVMMKKIKKNNKKEYNIFEKKRGD